jgi:hypothetical protein
MVIFNRQRRFVGRSHVIVLLAILLVAGQQLLRAQEHEHDQHQHDDHTMTPEMFTELRAKVSLYREYTDAQIMESMERMGPNFRVYLSDADVTGNVGVLALGHGFESTGNQEFQDAYAALAAQQPTAVGLGMAMMTSAHIQTAVDELTAAGAETIVVIPNTTVKYGGLTRQWGYIFGLRDEAAWMSVPKVQTDAAVIMAPTPTTHPILSAILLDYANAYSKEPASEVVAIVSHGPSEEEDNRKELAILEEHASRILANSDFAEVRGFTLQDDAPSAVRQSNVGSLRAWVEDANANDKRVIVLTTLLVEGSVHAKIIRDLDGLDYAFNPDGLMLHPDYNDWVLEVIDVPENQG